MTNAFEQAAAMASQQAPSATSSGYSQPSAYLPPPTLAESIAEPAAATSQLFSGPLLPSSLLNKSHLLGTERHGKIVKPPYDTHSRDFNSKQPKYWAVTPVMGANGKTSKITTNPIDHVTGEKLRPVLDTVIELATDYRFDAAEAAAVNRDPNLPDDGARAFYVSGNDLKELQKECRRLGITTVEGMVGLTLSVTRVAQKPNPGGNPSWINKITLSR
jgi:hypothetical protein